MDQATITRGTALPLPEQANAYTHCACEYCNNIIRFQASAAGRKAECPHCGRAIVLGAAALPALVMQKPATAQRLKRSRRTRVSRATFVLGWLLFLSGFLTLLGSIVTPLIGNETVARALTLVMSLLATAAGLTLMLEGQQTETYWVCSACENPLESAHTATCAYCAMELR